MEGAKLKALRLELAFKIKKVGLPLIGVVTPP